MSGKFMNSLTYPNNVQNVHDVLAKEDENRHLHPQVSLLMLRLYHLRKNFAVSMKFASQHV